MDFNPCMKHQLIRKTVREFSESEIKPRVAELDRESSFPADIMEKMKPLKFFGLQVPRELGGAGLDSISYAIAVEELSRVSAALGLCVTVHNSVGIYPILKFGSQEQIQTFVPPMAAGESIGAFCLTEANAGSDAGGVETVATPTDQGHLINGTKIFVTNGGICGTVLVFAVGEGEDSRPNVFIVTRDMAGFSVGEIEDLCGMRANPVSSLFFEDCAVSDSHLLGRPGQGLKVGLTALDTGRIGIAAQALGIAQAAYEDSLAYARERQQFNKPISAFQTIQNYLADMHTQIEASRMLLYRAAAAKDSGKPFSAEASMAKLHCSATARMVTDRAVQIH
ncbi:MAG: acyl-CoA dehydrogenase family protein, partial [Desulfobacterales bacterium]|nr:acyl-CoA dehydrogenase family protein [Desulfobacterales bacterium]